jgi:hypothetical protein
MYFELFIKDLNSHLTITNINDNDNEQKIELSKSVLDNITGNECSSNDTQHSKFNKLHCELFFVNMYMLLKKSFDTETFSIVVPISKEKQYQKLNDLQSTLKTQQIQTQTQNNSQINGLDFKKSFMQSFLNYIGNILNKTNDHGDQTGGDAIELIINCLIFIGNLISDIRNSIVKKTVKKLHPNQHEA